MRPHTPVHVRACISDVGGPKLAKTNKVSIFLAVFFTKCLYSRQFVFTDSLLPRHKRVRVRVRDNQDKNLTAWYIKTKDTAGYAVTSTALFPEQETARVFFLTNGRLVSQTGE